VSWNTLGAASTLEQSGLTRDQVVIAASSEGASTISVVALRGLPAVMTDPQELAQWHAGVVLCVFLMTL